MDKKKIVGGLAFVAAAGYYTYEFLKAKKCKEVVDVTEQVEQIEQEQKE